MAERAYQKALDWARTRVQGRTRQAPKEGGAAPIAYHPDIKRMLLTMKSYADAARAIGLYAALQLDLAKANSADHDASLALARGELLIPIVKGWSTEIGIAMASLGVQVHGGMGFIEETGAAQFYRDVRICAIYEGTTGIQALDLVGRKVGRDGGAAMTALIDHMIAEIEALPAAAAQAASGRSAALQAIAGLRAATMSLLASPDAAPAVAVPYLHLCGIAIGGWMMAKSLQIAGEQLSSDPAFYAGKQQVARFYLDNVLPECLALAQIVQTGAASITEADPALL